MTDLPGQMTLFEPLPAAFSLTVTTEVDGYLAVTLRTWMPGDGWFTHPPIDRLARRECQDVLDAFCAVDLPAWLEALAEGPR